MNAKTKPLHVYKCTVTHWDQPGSLSYGFLFAAITAESKAAAVRMAAANVENFRTCKVEQVVDADLFVRASGHIGRASAVFLKHSISFACLLDIYDRVLAER